MRLSLRVQVGLGFVLSGLVTAALFGHQMLSQRDLIQASLGEQAALKAEVLRAEMAAEAARALEAATQVATPEIASLTAARDRQALARALAPHFEGLRARNPSLEQHQIFVADPPTTPAGRSPGSGPYTTALLRMQAPTRFGDDVSGWRIIMNRGLEAACTEARAGFSGLEMSTSGVAMHGVATLCHEGRVAGVINVGFRLDAGFFQGIARRQPGSYALYLLANQGENGAAPSFRPLLTRGQVAFDPARHVLHPAGAMHAEPRLPAATLAAVFAGTPATELRGEDAIFAFPVLNFAGERIGVLEAVTDGRAAAAAQRQMMIAGAIALVALLVVMAGVLIVLNASILRPLSGMAATMRRIAEGDVDASIPGVGQGNEVGAMAAALQVFRDDLVEKRRLEHQQAEQATQRERRRVAMERYTKEFGESVASVMDSLGRSSNEMRDSADRMIQSADRTRSSAEHTVAGTDESARNLSSVAAAIEQLTASVGEIARQVAQAAQASRDAVSRAQATNQTVNGLSELAGQIDDVVRTINDIAGQTNLLALNATIEAARAGEAGKGFAVVASEVKTLAGQTAGATGRIAAQITAIQSATEAAVAAVSEVTGTIGQLSEIAATIAAAVEQQGAATREIAASVQAVATQNEDVTRSMRDVSDVAEASRVSSRAVLDAAEGLGAVSAVLRSEVEQFLGAMRSDDNERRRWVRLPGAGKRVMLEAPGRGGIACEVKDVSRGGAALRTEVMTAPGTEVTLDLPDGLGTVPARVLRCESGVTSIVFATDSRSVALIERLLDTLQATLDEPRRAA